MPILQRAFEVGFPILFAAGCAQFLGVDEYRVEATENGCTANEGCSSNEGLGQAGSPDTIGKVLAATTRVDEMAGAGPGADVEPQPNAPGDTPPDGGAGPVNGGDEGNEGNAGTGGVADVDGGVVVGFSHAACSPRGTGSCSVNEGCATDDDCAGNAAGTSCVTSGPLKGTCAACDPGDNSGCAWPNGRCDPEAPSCGPPPSCAGLGSTCRFTMNYGTGGYGGFVMDGMGANGSLGPGMPIPSGEDCCSSPTVTGGTYYRSNDENHPAKVSSFRLDRFEVVVGRFQRFVNAWVDGFRPSAGDGRHAHAHDGKGLAKSSGGYERGWDVAWADNLPTTATAWDANLSCEASYGTWPNNTMRPQTCVTWYEAYAFCIWDGGFLPSEAEWNYAAAGGAAQRQYPWGDTAPGADAGLAAYGCYYYGSGTCSGVMNIAPAGSIPEGDGLWGHADLAGNVWEWNLDWYSTSYSSTSCDDCTDSAPSQLRVRRGGSFRYSGESLVSSFRGRDAPMNRRFDGGFRCARAPN